MDRGNLVSKIQEHIQNGVGKDAISQKLTEHGYGEKEIKDLLQEAEQSSAEHTTSQDSSSKGFALPFSTFFLLLIIYCFVSMGVVAVTGSGFGPMITLIFGLTGSAILLGFVLLIGIILKLSKNNQTSTPAILMVPSIPWKLIGGTLLVQLFWTLFRHTINCFNTGGDPVVYTNFLQKITIGEDVICDNKGRYEAWISDDIMGIIFISYCLLVISSVGLILYNTKLVPASKSIHIFSYISIFLSIIMLILLFFLPSQTIEFVGKHFFDLFL